MSIKIRGHQPLLVTPMLEDGRVDEESLRNLIEYVITAGVPGIIVCGSTGEFFTLSPEERRNVMKIASDQVAGRVTLGFGVGDSGTDNAVIAAKYAEEVGADYLLVPPTYYAPLSHNTSDGFYHHYKKIADAVKIEIMLYDGGSGIEIPLDVIKRLHNDTKNINTVKVNLATPQKVKAIKALGIGSLCGTERLCLLMCGYGAQGFTVGVGNVLPKECTAVYDNIEAGKWKEAQDIFYSKMVPVINAALCSLPQFICSFKTLLYWKGIIKTPIVRLPLLPLDDVRKRELRYVGELVGIL